MKHPYYLSCLGYQSTVGISHGIFILCRERLVKYLGSWVDKSEKDISRRKAQAWRALNGMTKIWKANMSKDLKIRFFIATIESILLYGCESWALSKAHEK